LAERENNKLRVAKKDEGKRQKAENAAEVRRA
jgi:hypothetical protein